MSEVVEDTGAALAAMERAVSVEERREMMSTPFAEALMPKSLGQAMEWARHLYAARLVPAAIKTASDVLLTITYGQQLGLSPVQALQNLAPINGRLTVYGQMPLALVRRSGLLEEFDEKFFPDEEGGRAWCKVKRKGEAAREFSFSMADARKIKVFIDKAWIPLTDKPGPWQSFPARMLKFKCRNWLLGDVFGDVLLGMVTTDDASDMIEVFDSSEGAAPRSVVDLGRGEPAMSLEALLAEYSEDEAKSISAGFDQLAMTPAERRVMLRKHRGNSGAILDALRDEFALQRSRGGERARHVQERRATAGAKSVAPVGQAPADTKPADPVVPVESVDLDAVEVPPVEDVFGASPAPGVSGGAETWRTTRRSF